MANQEQLNILKQGVEVWNEWRAKNPGVHIDLRRADLHRARLYGADLNNADLTDADLSRVNFVSADLTDADLRRVDLSLADLFSASLRGANLTDADLSRTTLFSTNFSDANLRGANLFAADLNEADLSGADLSDALLAYTVFGAIDLSVVKGLETVNHSRPSSIGINTILRSQGKIPEAFLRGAGVPNVIIEAIPALIASLKPIDYYSCFISYSSKDQEFAEQLRADLVSKGVRCWFAPHSMRIGDEIRSRIDESIHQHEKLLLVLSESSLASTWVKKEVETAFEKEAQYNKLVLFPIRLDDTVMHTPQAWAADIRRMRHIGDFTRWKDHDAYQKAFDRLLRDLKAET